MVQQNLELIQGEQPWAEPGCDGSHGAAHAAVADQDAAVAGDSTQDADNEQGAQLP